MSTLFAVHYHFRPGGVRRVIELGLKAWSDVHRWKRVVMVTGELPHEDWKLELEKNLAEVEVIWEELPEARYLAEFKPGDSNHQLGKKLQSLVDRDQPNLIWAHNLSVGRNVFLGQALGDICGKTRIPLLCHHHDWWVDGRWERWPEMQRFGIQTLDEAAQGTLPEGLSVKHACVHPFDAAILKRHFGDRAALISQPLEEERLRDVSQAEIDILRSHLGPQPFWLAPCRILRRKNLLEALLLLKLLWPEGRLIVSGGPSSSAEEPCARVLQQAAITLNMEFQMHATGLPGMTQAALLNQASVFLQTSFKEGFGLVTMEAIKRGKPLLLRRLPGITEQLEALGAQFPFSYETMRIPREFVPEAETERLLVARQHLQKCVPPEWSARSHSPSFLAGETVDFGLLTVETQMELIQQEECFLNALFSANPALSAWKESLKNKATLPQCSQATFSAIGSSWVEQVEGLLKTKSPIGDSLLVLQELSASRA